MKRNSYDKRQKERLEELRRRVKANSETGTPVKEWPRATNARTYQYFITRERIYRLKTP